MSTRRRKQPSAPVRVRSDERKLHPLSIFHTSKEQAAQQIVSNKAGALHQQQQQQQQQPQPQQQQHTQHTQHTPRASGRAVKVTSRSATRHPRLQKLTEEQLDLLDHQVNRIVKEKAHAIYEALVRRFYPKKRENRVLTHDVAAHRVHAAFRYAVSELIDVRAIQERILTQLEGMISQRDNHNGFGFLLHVGNKHSEENSGVAKPQSLKDRIRSKKREIHEHQMTTDQQANNGKRSLRGAALWRHVVRQKHWKALMPQIDRIKPWEIAKYIEFPAHEIDIRSWKKEISARRIQFEDGRIQWMNEQFRSLHTEEENSNMNVIDEEGEEEEGEEKEEVKRKDQKLSPLIAAFQHTLVQHTTRDKVNYPQLHIVPEMASKRFDTWEEIVSLLQKQGIVSRNYHRLWENDQRRWPVRPPRPPHSASLDQKTKASSKIKQHEQSSQDEVTAANGNMVSAGNGAGTGDTSTNNANTLAAAALLTEDDETAKGTSQQKWPDRLGRYLLPNYALVHPSSKGTLEDYYASLSKNAPEKALVGIDAKIVDKVHIVIPPWFRVLAATSPLVPERSQLRTNWLRCEIPAVPTRPSTHVPRLGGIFSARPTSALPCSSYAPHMWNHSSSTKDSREKWKREHGKVVDEVEDGTTDLKTRGSGTSTDGTNGAHTAAIGETKEDMKKEDRRLQEVALQRQLASFVERDESKTMRWTKFLPEGASHMKQASNDTIDHDLVIRNLICKTTFLRLHAVEHHEKNRLMEVRTGGEDDTVRQAVISANPLVYMHRAGRDNDLHRGYHDDSSLSSTSSSHAAASPSSSSSAIVVPMRIPPFPHRVVHRLLKHLKEYVNMGPERLKVTFCPMELSRVLTAVQRAAIKQHKEKKRVGKSGALSKAAGAQILGGQGGPSKKGRGIRGLRAGGRRKMAKRRTGMVLIVKEKLPVPQPLAFQVADMFVRSTELLRYSATDRLALIVKYTTSSQYRKVSEVAANYWDKAAVCIDRLEGLAYEISRRADAEGKVGSVSRFHAVESKVMARWNVLTLLNEFDMAYNTVSGLLAILFVRFHDVIEWVDECYADRMVKTRTLMRRELTPSIAGTF